MQFKQTIKKPIKMEKQTKKNKKEVAVQAEVVPATMENQNESVESRIEFEIKKFNFTDSKLAELKQQFSGLEITGIEDKSGMKAVKEALSIVRNLRSGVEKKRTELKDFYLNTGRGIDAEAKRITEMIFEIEEPLKTKKAAIDAEIQRIKDEEAAAEEKRIEDRVDALKAAGIVFDGVFYSIGESVSVDLITIKDLKDDAFEQLLTVVRNENKKIQEARLIFELHTERRENALKVWSFLSEDERDMNFGEMSEESFESIISVANAKKNDFEVEQKRQADEAQKLIDDRKLFNYEKRSFRFEKAGFEIDEKGNAVFMNQIKILQVSRNFLETATNEQFEIEFQSMVANKKDVEEKIETRKKADQEQAEWNAKQQAKEAKETERMKVLSKIDGASTFGGFLNYANEGFLISELVGLPDSEFMDAVLAIKKTIADFHRNQAEIQEAERLSKLPELDKIERYCEELMKVDVPQLVSPDVQKELQLLRNELVRIVEKTLSNVKFLK